jgi:hypothetical protein
LEALDFIHGLFRESPVAAAAHARHMKKKKAKDINRYSLLLKSIKEFRIWMVKIERLAPFHFEKLFQDCLSCQGLKTRHLAADGNFRTGRRKKAGSSIAESALSLFLLNGEKTKAYVESSSAPSQRDSIPCSGFKAGDIVRSRSRMGIYDETGLMGLFCARHGTPLMFASMFHGERFAYLDLLLKQFIEKNTGLVDKIILYYDVSCRYKAHFRVTYFFSFILYTD